MKKILKMFIVTIIIVSVTIPVYAADGWVRDDYGWWYQNEDGSSPYGEWQLIDGEWYYFDYYGYMQTGWINYGGDWYLLADSGQMLTGWQDWNGDMYYFDQSGIMQTGWIYYNDDWYYCYDTGIMARKDFTNIDGVYYYFASDGRMTFHFATDLIILPTSVYYKFDDMIYFEAEIYNLSDQYITSIYVEKFELYNDYGIIAKKLTNKKISISIPPYSSKTHLFYFWYSEVKQKGEAGEDINGYTYDYYIDYYTR